MKFSNLIAALLVGGIAVGSASIATAADQPAASSSTAATPIPGAVQADWKPPASYPTDITVGIKDAPVTIVEYGSMTCPHCALFQNEKFPALKKEWIDTGKVRFVFRQFPIDQAAMGAAMLVACLPAASRHDAVSALYKDVNAWATKPLKESIPATFSEALGRKFDFESDFGKCLADAELQKSVLTPAFEANKGGVAGTPTFFVNGEKIVGYSEAEPRQIDDLIVRKLGELYK